MMSDKTAFLAAFHWWKMSDRGRGPICWMAFCLARQRVLPPSWIPLDDPEAFWKQPLNWAACSSAVTALPVSSRQGLRFVDESHPLFFSLNCCCFPSCEPPTLYYQLTVKNWRVWLFILSRYYKLWQSFYPTCSSTQIADTHIASVFMILNDS